MKPVRTLLVYAESRESATLSYQTGWPRELRRHPRFDCTPLNVLDPRASRRVQVGSVIRRGTYDAVVLLHSVFSNVRYLPGNLARALKRLRAVKVYFIGNEYKLMPQKLAFCEEVGIGLLVSQFTSDEPLRLYRERLEAKVVGIPNTGFDPALFRPSVPIDERPIDLGYRAHRNRPALGHREREEVAERFEEAASRHGLGTDISLDPGDRFTEPEWAAFLNRCKGQVGSEAGGDYFELTDETTNAVMTYVEDHPGAAFEEVHARFFRDYPNPVPGRALSGRVVEAAATKSVQLLLDGEYGGYFRPDVHYIPVRKDFSNVDEAIAKFRDRRLSDRIRDEAYELVCEHLTYPKLIDRFHAELAPLLP